MMASTARIKTGYWCLLPGVLGAVPTQLPCRRQAFRRVLCTVSITGVRCAGMPHDSRQRVRATASHAFPWTAAAFYTETLAERNGGTSRITEHGFFPAMFGAMWRSKTVCAAGASTNLAQALSTGAYCRHATRFTRAAQPSSLHTFFLPPPCLLHRPLSRAALVQLLRTQGYIAMFTAPSSSFADRQPSAEHAIVLLHFPRLVMALLVHKNASVVQYLRRHA